MNVSLRPVDLAPVLLSLIGVVLLTPLVRAQARRRGLVARPDGSQVIATQRRGAAIEAARLGADAGHELRRVAGPGFFD